MKKYLEVIIISILILVNFVPCRASPDNTSELSDIYSYVSEKYDVGTKQIRKEEKVTVGEFFGVTDGEDSKDTSKIFDGEEYLKDFYDSIPEEIKKELPSDETDTSFEKYGPEFFLEKIKSVSKTLLFSANGSLSAVLSLLIVSAVFKKFSEGAESGTGQALSFLCTCAVFVCIFETEIFDPAVTGNFLVSLREVTTAVLPTLAFLLAATGNVTTAALTGQNITLLCAVLEHLYSSVLFPFICASAGLCIVGCITSEKAVLSLSSFFKKISDLITVFSMAFFVFVMAMQSAFATAADTLGLKTVKFAVGSFVPLVGGAVSETLGLVGGGFTYVKNTCGGVALAVIFILLLPPLLSLIFEKFIFSLLGAVSGLLDLPETEKLFCELSSIINCFIAITVSAAVVFIFIIIFVINCSVRLGGA